MVTKYQSLFLVAITTFIIIYLKEYVEFNLSMISITFENIENSTKSSFVVKTIKKQGNTKNDVGTEKENKEVW